MSAPPTMTPQEADTKARALLKADRKWQLDGNEITQLLEIAVQDEHNGWAYSVLGWSYLQTAKKIAESQAEKEELWKKASIIYRKGSNLGFGKCANALGNMLRTGGPGVSPDHVEALRLFEMAADVGMVDSAISAYKMCKRGEGGLPKDWARAFASLKKVSRSRELPLLKAIGRFYLDAPPPLCDVAAARVALRNALDVVKEQKKISNDINEINKSINAMAGKNTARAKADIVVLQADLQKLKDKMSMTELLILDDIEPKIHRAMGEALLREGNGVPKDVVGAAAEFKLAADEDITDNANIFLALMCLNGELDEKQNKQSAAMLYAYNGYCSNYAKKLLIEDGVAEKDIPDFAPEYVFRILCRMSPAMQQLAAAELPKMSADEHFAMYKKLSAEDAECYDSVTWPRHLKAACDGGHAEAASIMGLLIKTSGRQEFMMMNDCICTPAEALRLLQEAHKRGSDLGTTLLAECLYEGYATEKDAASAAALLKRPANRGCASAQMLLGKIYLETLTGHWKDGFSYLNKAHVNKDTRLMNRSEIPPLLMVAIHTERGVGSKKGDKRAAAAIYRKIIEDKNMYTSVKDKAFHRLGMIYLNGDGKTSNATKAFQCFQKVSSFGNSEALCELANLYLRGIGTERSQTKASDTLGTALLLDCHALEAIKRFNFPENLAKEICVGRRVLDHINTLQNNGLSSFAAPSSGLPICTTLPDDEVVTMAGMVYTKRAHRNVWSERWVALTVNGVLRFYSSAPPGGKIVRTAILKIPFDGYQLEKPINASGKRITPISVKVSDGKFLFISIPENNNQLWLSVMPKVCAKMVL